MILKLKHLLGILTGRKKHWFDPNHIDIDMLEQSTEQKLAYILALLSVNAFRKSDRKSLPTSTYFSRKFEGELIAKIVQQWTSAFIRKSVSMILNEGITKMRFYIHIDRISKKEGIFPRGEMIITLHYTVHQKSTVSE